MPDEAQAEAVAGAQAVAAHRPDIDFEKELFEAAVNLRGTVVPVLEPSSSDDGTRRGNSLFEECARSPHPVWVRSALRCRHSHAEYPIAVKPAQCQRRG